MLLIQSIMNERPLEGSVYRIGLLYIYQEHGDL